MKNQIFDKNQVGGIRPFDEIMESILLDTAQSVPVLILDYADIYQDSTRFNGTEIVDHHIIPFASPPCTKEKIEGVQIYNDPMVWWRTFLPLNDHAPLNEDEIEGYILLTNALNTVGERGGGCNVGAVAHELEQTNTGDNVTVSRLLVFMNGWIDNVSARKLSALNQGVGEELWLSGTENNIVVFNARDPLLSWGEVKFTAQDLIYGLIEMNRGGVVFINDPTMWWTETIETKMLLWLLQNSTQLNVQVWVADHNMQEFLSENTATQSHWQHGNVIAHMNKNNDLNGIIVHANPIHVDCFNTSVQSKAHQWIHDYISETGSPTVFMGKTGKGKSMFLTGRGEVSEAIMNNVSHHFNFSDPSPLNENGNSRK